jgi:hypothetical protein
MVGCLPTRSRRDPTDAGARKQIIGKTRRASAHRPVGLNGSALRFLRSTLEGPDIRSRQAVFVSSLPVRKTRAKHQERVMAKNAIRVVDQLNLMSVLPEPRVVPIYWDPHFRKAPADVAAFDEFLRTLFRSSWMSELAGYGLLPPRLLKSFTPRDEAPAILTRTALEAKLVDWLASGAVSPKPKRADRSLIFLVLTPRASKLTPREAKRPSSAYVASNLFERDSVVRGGSASEHNLVYSVVPLLSTEGEILEQHSLPVSQALTHALVRCVRKH